MRLTAAILSLFVASGAAAGGVSILEATATPSGQLWRFDVTLAHDDTGWDHYADGWAVLTPDGRELGFRKLHHPHVDEQPFTRSHSGVAIPDDIGTVFIRAHDSVHGWSEAQFEVILPR